MRKLTRVLLKLNNGNYQPDTGKSLSIKTDESTPVLVANAIENPPNSGNYEITWNEIPKYGFWYVNNIIKEEWGRLWLGSVVGNINYVNDFLVDGDLSVNGNSNITGSLTIGNPIQQPDTLHVEGDIKSTNTISTKVLNASVGVNTNTITSDYVRQSFGITSVLFQPLVGNGISITTTTGSFSISGGTGYGPGGKARLIGGGSADSVGGDVELAGGFGLTEQGKVKIYSNTLVSGSVTIGNTILQPDQLHVEGDIKSTNNVKAQKFLANVTDSAIISVAGNIKSQGGNVIFSKIGGVDVTLDAPSGTSNHFIGFLPVATGRSANVNVKLGFKPQQLYNYQKATVNVEAGDTDDGEYKSAVTIQGGGAFNQDAIGGHIVLRGGFGNADQNTAGKYPYGGNVIASGSNVIIVANKFDTTNSTKTVLSKTGINNPNPDTANFALDVTGRIQVTDSIYANWGHGQFIDQPSVRLGYPNLRNGVLRFECIDTTNHIEIESNDSILANRKQYLQDKDGKIVLEENGSIYVPQKLHASGAVNIKQLDPYAGERDALNVAGGITLSAPTASIRIDSWHGDIIRQTIGPGKCDVADWFIGWKDGLDGAGSYDIARMTLMAGNTTYGRHDSKITIQGGGADGQDEQGGHVVIRGGYGNNDITTAGKYPYGGEVHISGSVVRIQSKDTLFNSKVGIGKSSTNNTLDVLGTVSVTGSVVVTGSVITDKFQMTSGAVSGYVLTSDANGNAYWASGSGGGGTTNHAALTNLDYSASGHTGFAGTQVPNTFTQSQTISGSLTVFPASGSNFALNIREWSATGSVYTEPSVLTLDDAHFDGTYANVSRLTYNTQVDDGVIIINVSDANSNPNKYWVYNTLTNQFYSNQLMDTNWKNIPGGYGLRIRFDSVTGHGLNDRWNIRIKDIPALKIYKNDQRESTSYPILQFRNNGIVINNNPSGLLNPPFQDNIGIFVNEYADESNPWAHGIITQVSQKISSSVNFNTLGNYIRSQIIGGSTGTNTGNVLGQFTVAANYSATTASNVIAGQYACEFWGGSGTTTNAYAVQLRFAGINNNCTIYNGRGLYIEPLYHPRILNGTYAIYQEGSQDWNYFAGKVGIGKLSPNNTLDVLGTVSVTGSVVANNLQMTPGLQNGEIVFIDNNGVLKTDSSFVWDNIGKVLHIGELQVRREGSIFIDGTNYSYLLFADKAANGILFADGWGYTIKADNTTNLYFRVGSGDITMYLSSSRRVGIGVTSPTAYLHLKAGTFSENGAPLKFTAGTNLTVPENGAMEYDGVRLYFTTGGSRKSVALASTSGVVNGGVVFTDNNGVLTTNSNFVWDNTNKRLGIWTTSPEDELHVQGTTKIVGLTQVSGSIKIRDGVYTKTKVVDDSMSPYFVSSSDYIILADSTSSQVDIVLPDASMVKGQNIIIKVIDASSGVKINTVNGLIDGMTDINLVNQYSFIHVVSDGSNWYIISQFNV